MHFETLLRLAAVYRTYAVWYSSVDMVNWKVCTIKLYSRLAPVYRRYAVWYYGVCMVELKSLHH